MPFIDDISLPTYALCKKLVDGGGGGGGSSTAGTVGTIVLGTSWSGSGDGPYTQTVTASGYTVTANTVVDLVADSNIIAQMTSDGVTQIYISNANATLTAVAIGSCPSIQLSLQAIFSEVN